MAEPSQPGEAENQKPETSDQNAVLGCLFLVLLAFGGCVWVFSGDDSGGGGGDGGGGGGGRDILAERACRTFRSVASDASAGHLTDAELRERLREVNEQSQMADDDDVRSAASDMFAAITQGDDVRFSSAIEEMASACAKH